MPPRLYQGWSVWPREYGRRDGMWLLRSGYKRHWLFLGSFTVSLSIQSLLSHLRWVKPVTMTLRYSTSPIGRPTWETEASWHPQAQRTDFLPPVMQGSEPFWKHFDDYTSATSLETWCQTLPATLLLNSWASETRRWYVCSFKPLIYYFS